MKLFSITAIAAALSSATQANARVAAPNDCIEKIQGIWQYIVNGGDGNESGDRIGNTGGYPTVVIIACTEVLEDVKAGIDVDGQPIEWGWLAKPAASIPRAVSIPRANVCSFIGYFRPEQITKIGGQCAWGYVEGDLESNNAMVVLEPQNLGEPGPFCDAYSGVGDGAFEVGDYRGKGIVQTNGFNVIRYSEDSGESVYNNNFPRIGAPYRK